MYTKTYSQPTNPFIMSHFQINTQEISPLSIIRVGFLFIIPLNPACLLPDVQTKRLWSCPSGYSPRKGGEKGSGYFSIL